jgi:triacylglycerol lipase
MFGLPRLGAPMRPGSAEREALSRHTNAAVTSSAGTKALETIAGGLGAIRHLASLVTPQVALGTAVEAAWLTAHIVTYPYGLVRGQGGTHHHGYRVEHLPPLTRGMLISNLEAAGTPIMLVHGLIDNRSIFTVLRRGLTRRGFTSIYAMNYSPTTSDLRTAALQLSHEVERIVEETGYERIHIIAHSLGGLIARYYVTRLGGDERVHTLVSLGTPHKGTLLAYALPLPVLRQMRPGSGLLKELDEPVPGCRTRFITYWTDADQLVLPQRNATLHHRDLSVRNIKLHGIGHASLPILNAVVQGISTSLAQLEHDGTIITPGVTALDSTSGAVADTPTRARRSRAVRRPS